MTTYSCIISKKGGVCSIDSVAKSLLSGLSATKKLVFSTIFRGLTNKSNPDRIKRYLTKGVYTL
jgi:hypothetical protein